MKLVISKSKDKKSYYSKLKNDFNGKHIEKYLMIQTKEDLEYGLYEVDGFISPYEKKDGTVDLKLVLTSVKPIEIYEKKETNPFEEFGNSIETESDIGEQITIEDADLPF